MLCNFLMKFTVMSVSEAEVESICYVPLTIMLVLTNILITKILQSEEGLQM